MDEDIPDKKSPDSLEEKISQFFEGDGKYYAHKKFREFFRSVAEQFNEEIKGVLPQITYKTIDGRTYNPPPFRAFFDFLRKNPELLREFRMQYLLNFTDIYFLGPRAFLDSSEIERLNQTKFRRIERLFEDLDWMRYISPLSPEEKKNTFLMFHDYIYSELLTLTLGLYDSEKVSRETNKTAEEIREVIE